MLVRVFPYPISLFCRYDLPVVDQGFDRGKKKLQVPNFVGDSYHYTRGLSSVICCSFNLSCSLY